MLKYLLITIFFVYVYGMVNIYECGQYWMYFKFNNKYIKLIFLNLFLLRWWFQTCLERS